MELYKREKYKMNNNTNNEFKKEFLPIGTVVLLQNGTHRVMITGFCVISEENGDMFDYTGVMYPEGMLNSQQSLVFNHKQIKKVFAIGYSDQEEKDFKKELLKTLNSELDKAMDNIFGNSEAEEETSSEEEIETL